MKIDAKQIPDEVAMNALHLSDLMAEVDVGTMKIAIAAALNAWEGVKWHTVQVPDDSDEVRYMLKKVGIILPLPKDAADE